MESRPKGKGIGWSDGLESAQKSRQMQIMPNADPECRIMLNVQEAVVQQLWRDGTNLGHMERTYSRVDVQDCQESEDHKWYDELTNGKLKEEALMHKARFEESWGDATLGVMKFCAWLKSSFENFYELDYDVLVKLEECWNYGANNAGNTQDNKKEHHDPSICNIRIFELMKYSIDADNEYVAI
ncbi:hypothetical protein Tco_1439497 [Tanacetum coccineum]